MDIGPLAEQEIEDVVALWERCGLTRPWNDPRADIALARASPMSEVLAGRSDDRVVASAMVGSDGHRGWVYYLATEPALRRQGLGRAMLQACEAWVRQRGVPKIQLMVRAGNATTIGFYEALGYLREDTVILGMRFDGRSWAVAPGREEPTDRGK